MLPKPEYSRKLNRSTLTLTITKEDYESEIDCIEMFHYNKIPYFLHMDTQKENISLKCSYDITGRHSLDSLLKYKTLNSQLLRNILVSFDQACIHAEKYLLTENDILLEPEFIFSKSDCSQFVFCYLPGSKNEIHRQFQSLMEDLLQKTDHKDVQAVKIAYGVHQNVAIDQCPLHTVLENLESYCTDQILHASSLEYAKSLPSEQPLELNHSLVQEEPSPYAGFPEYTDPAQYNQPPQTADVHQSKMHARYSDAHTCIRSSQITDPPQSQKHTAGFDTQPCIQPPQTADVHQSKVHPLCSDLQLRIHSTQVGDAHQSKIHPPCSNTQPCIQPPQITNAPLSPQKATYDNQSEQPAHHPISQQLEQATYISHQQNHQPSQCDQSLQHNPLLQYAESPQYTEPPQHSEPLQHSHSELFQHSEPPQHSEPLQHSEPSPNSLTDSSETLSQKFPKQLTRKKKEYPEKEKASLKHQAVEKLKNIIHKKLYTNRSKLPDEAPVFEADEEEITSSNPTVCLMPDSDIIQNIFIYQGADRTRDFSCSSQKSVLGSSIKDSNIYIPLPKISRVHAIVEIDEHGTFLEDMNSTNGTYINDELLPYHERRMLQKGDIISLAGECYSFH